MSIQASFAVLKSLQVLDSRIGKLQEELATEKSGISEKAERHVSLLARVAKIESVVSSMEGTKQELNQELRQHLLQVDKAREKMARCRNEREANAAQREMEEIRRLCREREVEIQKLTGLIGDARADVEVLEKERTDVAGQIDETEGDAANKVRVLQVDLQKELDKRTAALEQLPNTIQRRYHAVHAKRGTGTAAVVKGSCSACHIALSPMIHQELMRYQELFQCPSCHRVLYIDESASSDDATDAELEESASEADSAEN